MEVIAIPETINAGDSIDLTVSLGSYPASDSWGLKLVIINSSAKYEVDSSASGDDHIIEVLPTTSDEWSAGKYKWVIFAVKGSTDRVRISTGDIEILPDIDVAATADLRTHAEKVLDAIEAVLEGKATSDDYQVNVRGKMLTRYSYEELLNFRRAYRAEVLQERRSRKKKLGKSGASLYRVRF